MVCLGWQWVVIAFAALALAAEDDGSCQKEEGGGDQQEQAEPSKNPYNLQGEQHKFSLIYPLLLCISVHYLSIPKSNNKGLLYPDLS